jgi:aromatic ring-opening dioxygenase catalytic subunit (LigB family)
MQNDLSSKLSPVLFIPHGGGPLPLMEDKSHEHLIVFLKEIAKKLKQPSAIVLISAHWEENIPTITGGSHPDIIYDYNNFPPETYKIQYPASGHPQLASQVKELMEQAGIDARLDEGRGFDHGMFVPLKLIYPDAEIPCIQVSLLSNLNPESHIALGKSLASLREKNVLIMGSGLSFHNMHAFFSDATENNHKNVEFDEWIIKTCAHDSMSPDEREARLINWESAPHARYCHPREEHLLPLHVCYGAASEESTIAELVFNNKVLGQRVSGLLWR